MATTEARRRFNKPSGNYVRREDRGLAPSNYDKAIYDPGKYASHIEARVEALEGHIADGTAGDLYDWRDIGEAAERAGVASREVRAGAGHSIGTPRSIQELRPLLPYDIDASIALIATILDPAAAERDLAVATRMLEKRRSYQRRKRKRYPQDGTGLQVLICERCGQGWFRSPRRGPRPRVCDNCARRT